MRGGFEGTRRRWAWIFLLPLLISLGGVAGWPLARTAMLSLTNAELAGDTARYIGWGNYLSHGPDPAAYDAELGGYYVFDEARGADLIYRPDTGAYVDMDTGTPAPAPNGAELFGWHGVLADADWWHSVGVTLLLAGASVALETLLGVGIALYVNRRLRARGLMRAAVLVPWAIPTVISAQMWNWMLNDQYGVINAALVGLGLIERGLPWTAEPGLALAAIVAVDVWKTTPFIALLSLAALQTIPDAVREAAWVDGVTRFGMFRYITLPLILPAVMVAVTFRAIDALRLYDLVYVLTGATKATATMSIYARQQMVDFQHLGFGSAASMLLVVVVGLVAALLLTFGRLRGTEGVGA